MSLGLTVLSVINLIYMVVCSGMKPLCPLQQRQVQKKQLEQIQREQLQPTQTLEQIIEFSSSVAETIGTQHDLSSYLKELWTLAVDRVYVFRTAIRIPKLLQLIKTMIAQSRQLHVKLDVFLWDLFFSKFPVNIQDYRLIFEEITKGESVGIIIKRPFNRKYFEQSISTFFASIIPMSDQPKIALTEHEFAQFAQDMFRLQSCWYVQD